MMLGLAAALAIAKGSIGNREAEPYARIFLLVEAAAAERARRPELTDTELHRAIEVLSHALISHPEETAEAVLDRAAIRLAADLGSPVLSARRN